MNDADMINTAGIGIEGSRSGILGSTFFIIKYTHQKLYAV